MHLLVPPAHLPAVRHALSATHLRLRVGALRGAGAAPPASPRTRAHSTRAMAAPMGGGMQAAQVSAFGDGDTVLDVSSGVEIPQLGEGHRGNMLVRVRFASLTPGDHRRITGELSGLWSPVAWPYVPGGDVAGVVVDPGEAPEGYNGPDFKAGDAIIGSWAGELSGGALAEYHLVGRDAAVVKPPGLSFAEGAALANSACFALRAVEDQGIARGERVLVLGGAGGVGSTIVQLAKSKGAHVVATSTAADFVTVAGADQVIDYRETDWWAQPEFQEQPFDVVFDCAEGVGSWRRARKHQVVKNASEGGRFVAVVPGPDWRAVIQTRLQMAAWIAPILLRMLWTRVGLLARLYPRYSMLFAGASHDTMAEVVRAVQEGRMRPLLCEESPFPFTREGVRGAFRLLASRRAHGKIVIGPIGEPRGGPNQATRGELT